MKERSYIPIAYHATGTNNYCLLRREVYSSEFFLCVPLKYAVGENIGERRAIRAIIEHEYNLVPEELQNPIALENVPTVFYKRFGISRLAMSA